MYERYFKRIIDLFLSTIGFLIILPLSFVIFLVLYFTNDRKPIFLQPRPGKNEKNFNILKIKTMSDEKVLQGKLLPYEISNHQILCLFTKNVFR
ncbi:sugar transferase [Arenibacter sp. 6A1]|uniref:sugar transferase n=1 Tax=Arenibacter sp. 6A1 TaxID=2720391 RepID=UPI0014455E37|nr:sugar transferase [Arenibacter sp. 6A1]